MKKGLSVLLIVAALFGFYGGATSLNDILASKDYWEEVGEKSTADMNKLEDGLNQLKDNEQAYLDGLKTLEEGEKTLAEGEASYAAAPGLLAEGEAELADGYDSYNKLNKLISGLNTVKKHGTLRTKNHDVYWHDGFSWTDPKKAEGSPGLRQARGLIVKTLQGLDAETLALVQALAGQDIATPFASASSYSAFDGACVKASKALTPAEEQLASYATTASKAAASAAKIDATKPETYTEAPTLIGYVSTLKGYAKINAIVGGVKPEGYGGATVDQIIQGAGLGLNSWQDLLNAVAADPTGTTAVGAADKISLILGSAVPMLKQYDAMLKGVITNLDKWDAGYQTLAAAKDGKGSNDLASKTEGIPFAFDQMLTNSTIKAALKQYDPGLIRILKKYTGNRLKNEDLDKFDSDLTYIATSVVPRAQKVLAKVKTSAQKQLADGEAQLAQGYADYAAAPAQLEEGRKMLADGKAQLAQYEDGEQQIRDGLATLMATEPDPGLTSILERIGDDDFDNGDAHLEIEEGLNAVEVGRGYQADSGALITKEITNRAIGTAAGLAAGALAVLAAILSFLKKNKGAGISALIAAAAGLLGCFVGMGAGEYYSDIAGSTVGSLPFIAAGVLAAVAIVFAVVHFQAKPEAKAEAK